MKDSGIPWIGMIPEDWKVLRLKNLYSERTELSSNGSELLLSISEYYGVAPTAEKTDNDFITRAETLVGYKKCFKNDFVSNIMLAWKGSFGTTDYDGIISPAYCVYKPINDICPHYYHYLLRTDLFKCVFKQYSKGVIDSRLRLYSPYFLAIHTIYPPLSEQEVIASWLDEKCGEIDDLIEVEQKMIVELEAYRQAIITETATRGLNPEAPMRQTGISWIPKIPEHWGISRIGLHFNLILGKMLCPKPLDDKYTNEKYLCAANVHFREIDTSLLKKMWFSPNEKNLYEVKLGDLLIVEGGAGAGGCCVVNEIEDRIYIQNSIIIARSASVSSTKYLAYLIESLVKQNYIDIACNKATFSHFTKEKVGNTPFVIPPLPEQQAIADYLDTKCKEIDELIAVKREKIDTLKQYRQSIIFEAVTGKLNI